MVYNKFIRIGHTATGTPLTGYTCSDLANFPTPSNLEDELNDADKDPFTDLLGFTHRNRVREDALVLNLSYNYLTDEDKAYILNRISPVWFYVELIDAKTLERKTHKMYASSKKSAYMRAKEYTYYMETESGTSGRLEVVSNSSTPTSTQIKLQDVTPTMPSYTPSIGDYVITDTEYQSEFVAFSVSFVEE